MCWVPQQAVDGAEEPRALNIDTAADRWSLTLAGALEYAVEFEVCGDPLCTCGEMVLRLSPVGDPGGKQQTVFLDIYLKGLAENKDGTLKEGSAPPLSWQVAETLSAADWGILTQLFLVSSRNVRRAPTPRN